MKIKVLRARFPLVTMSLLFLSTSAAISLHDELPEIAQQRTVAQVGSGDVEIVEKMPPALWKELDAVMIEQYKSCWSKEGNEHEYIAEILVDLKRDGTFAERPILLNLPVNKQQEEIAFGALKAVLRCNPLVIPTKFISFHKEWHKRILRFDMNSE